MLLIRANLLNKQFAILILFYSFNQLLLATEAVDTFDDDLESSGNAEHDHIDQDDTMSPPPVHDSIPHYKHSDDFDSDHHHYDSDGHHDDEFDHEAITGSRSEAAEFKDLSPEESRRRLGLLVDKMDLNKDGNIDNSELNTWILNSFKKLDIENSRHRIEDHDENNDTKVTWDEYIHKTYGYTDKELQEFENQTSDDTKGFVQMIKEERFKFNLADVNKDGFLTLEEYPAFMHPHNYPHMAPYEVARTMTDFDKNKDGFVDLKEFIGDGKVEPDLIEGEKHQFEELDKDKNGKLDKLEIIPWIMIGFIDTAKKETIHLFKETDADKDAKLSKKEILDQNDLWVGSHATDYGKHLEELETKKEL